MLEKSLKFIANFLNDNPRIKKKVLDVMPQKDGDEELLSLLKEEFGANFLTETFPIDDYELLEG